MATIYLQLIGEYFYPTNSVSKEILLEEFRLERFPEHRFDAVAPILVRKGNRLAVSDYSPQISEPYIPRGEKIGGEAKSVENPCKKCYLRGLCDDGCGRKLFRLFSRK